MRKRVANVINVYVSPRGFNLNSLTVTPDPWSYRAFSGKSAWPEYWGTSVGEFGPMPVAWPGPLQKGDSKPGPETTIFCL